ncbi:MerR family transcriptional regulator [Furfurilactobacillus milii]|uniref:MerR family transcriptional regulator n=1 Tax=Furfurilactobacillus milii TaxID=2888272 RepID=A0A6N9I394_9LACO|nr:MerR family transcriptional regulator [Furfurilactobacillus milii]MYV16813.1 MerR family transcriptional regulator [Furfurilactobacillus milii]
MAEKQLRRSLAILPMSTVMALTDLSARQIRYYETQALVHPARNEGNRRRYSLNDVDRLLEVKDGLASGMDFATMRRLYAKTHQVESTQLESKRLSDERARHLLEAEMQQLAGMRPPQSGLQQHL